MKALEQFIIQTRSRVRARRARLLGGGRPARLTLRLDDLDAPGVLPGPVQSLAKWREEIIRVVEWTGALPTTVIGRSENSQLGEVVRFAHRLECPTRLRTCARGLAPRAEELVDAGLDEAWVRVAGVSEAAQQAVLGETLDDAKQALEALMQARGSRSARLDVFVEVPVDARSTPALRDLVTFARGLGVDGLRLAVPWQGGPWDGPTRDALAWAESQKGGFFRTSPDAFGVLERMAGDGPGAARAGGRCPVGSLHLELLPDGSARSCPFVGAAVPLGDVATEGWEAMAGDRDAIRRCGRHCAHPDLA